MRLSYKHLQNLRSGQSVWRVWGCSHRGVVEVSAEHYIVLGKKIWHTFNRSFEDVEPHRSRRMKCRRIEVLEQAGAPRNSYENAACFLGDLQGLGAFTSRRHAQRFVDEIHAGLHPDITARLIFDEEMDRRMDDYLEDYPEDYMDDDWGDHGE